MLHLSVYHCVSVVLYIVASGVIKSEDNNVCKTFFDYYLNINNMNKNCYYNPDGTLDVPGIVARHGYPVESYNVTTTDGYILKVFRIPHGKNPNKISPGQPVFLQHGICLSSVSFVNRGNKSLAYILADNGYDVWLGNFRGSSYSRNHRNLLDTDKRYWNFSFHELGIYDMRAQLTFVKNATAQKVIYIGFSLGTTAGYVYSLTYPEEAYTNMKIQINLSPIAFMKDVKSLVAYFVPVWNIIEPVLNIGSGEFATNRSVEIFKQLCFPLPFQLKFCQLIPMLIFGVDYEQNDPETLPITFLQNRDSTSVKLLSHYIQLMRSGNFEYFDYGKEQNMNLYGSSEPPKYNLSKIKVPNYLIRGNNDLLSTEPNVLHLNESLAAEAKPYDIHVVNYDKFSHSDFIVAKQVKELLYNHVIDFVNKL